MNRDADSHIDYRALAEFRYQIRRFLRFSERAAREAGLEPQQHQLLLAIKGLPENARANIGEIAERLQIQHHSTVELIDRLTERGYVTRKRSADDRREVLVQLSAKGEKALRELTEYHQDEIGEIGPELVSALRKVVNGNARSANGKNTRRRALAATA